MKQIKIDEKKYPEFKHFIDKNPELKPLSIKSYYNNYIRIRKSIEPINELTEKVLNNYIDNFEDSDSWESDMPPSVNTIINIINVIIQIKRSYDQSIDLLLSKRNELYNIRDKNEVDHLNKLPKKRVISSYLKKLYTDGLYQKFIINFLIFYYYLKPTDLNIAIVNKITDTKNHHYNYLVVSASHINLVRYGFKTGDKYGRKSFSIKTKIFKDAINKLLKERNADFDKNKLYFLINTGNNKPINSSLHAKFIKNKLYNQLKYSDYHKINILDAIDNENNVNFRNASERLGIEYNELIAKYDIDN